MISISHVVGWYDLANPASWAVYLSVAVEIAAMSAIAAASVRIKGFSVWFVFSIVTLIQFIGNIYFSYTEIDVNSQGFKDWIDLIAPITDAMGSNIEDIVAQRRFLAILEGGLLPLISLTCLHFFIGYGEGSETSSTPEMPAEENPIEPVIEPAPEPTIPEIEVDATPDLEPTDSQNNESTPQIDIIEEDTAAQDEVPAANEIPQNDYLENPEGPARDIGVKVTNLSQKMKKILNR